MLLTEIEKNNTIQQMYIDKSNEAIAIEDTNSRLDDVFQMAISMAHTLRTIRKESTEIIIDDLMKSEPFCYYPKLKDLLKNNLKDEFNG